MAENYVNKLFQLVTIRMLLNISLPTFKRKFLFAKLRPFYKIMIFPFFSWDICKVTTMYQLVQVSFLIAYELKFSFRNRDIRMITIYTTGIFQDQQFWREIFRRQF